MRQILLCTFIISLAALAGPSPVSAKDSPKKSDLHMYQGRLWISLDRGKNLFGLKEETRSGQRVLCRDELCILLPSDRIRKIGDREMIDLQWLQSALAPAEKKTAPQGETFSLTLPTVEGKELSLSQFRGKKVVAYLWGSW